MDKEALKREQLIAYIPSRDNYMTVGLYAAKPGKVLVAMVLNLHTGLPRTKKKRGATYFTMKKGVPTLLSMAIHTIYVTW